jgi:hypothetical protein
VAGLPWFSVVFRRSWNEALETEQFGAAQFDKRRSCTFGGIRCPLEEKPHLLTTADRVEPGIAHEYVGAPEAPIDDATQFAHGAVAGAQTREGPGE